MYNFRYHLVTIVSIFAALVIGLLLGVAITGSELVQNASDDLVDDLLEQFNQLSSENVQLNSDLQVERSLDSQLFNHWQQERLQGRNILIITGAHNSDTALAQELALTVQASGGSTAVITLLDPSLGLQDSNKLAALQKLCPAVSGQDYSQTLAAALLAEWTQVRITGPLSTPASQAAGADEDSGAASDQAANGQDEADQDAQSGTAESAVPQAADDVDEAAQSSSLPDDPTSSAPLLGRDEQDLASAYPLTQLLLEQGSLYIEVDYSVALAQKSSAWQPGQYDYLAQAASANLPYAANGLVNLAVERSDDGVSVNLWPAADCGHGQRRPVWRFALVAGQQQLPGPGQHWQRWQHRQHWRLGSQ